jgi:hypothetical protein
VSGLRFGLGFMVQGSAFMGFNIQGLGYEV